MNFGFENLYWEYFCLIKVFKGRCKIGYNIFGPDSNFPVKHSFRALCGFRKTTTTLHKDESFTKQQDKLRQEVAEMVMKLYITFLCIFT